VVPLLLRIHAGEVEIAPAGDVSARIQAPGRSLAAEPLPAIQTVRTVLEQLRIELASSGRRVSVLSLARRPGIPNTTLRRTYPEIYAEIAAATRTAATESAADDSAYARHQRDNAALRRANRELAEHLELAIANIQRLSIDNHRLRQDEAATSVTGPPQRRAQSHRGPVVEPQGPRACQLRC
jgi:hypothetical protein